MLKSQFNNWSRENIFRLKKMVCNATSEDLRVDCMERLDLGFVSSSQNQDFQYYVPENNEMVRDNQNRQM